MTRQLFSKFWLTAGLACALAVGCEPPDEDGDGYLATSDCDDANPDRAPNQVEVCNSVDDDCDGEVDENLQVAYYLDADGDGFGNTDAPTLSCSRPDENHVTTPGDCNDDNIAAYPGAVEECNDIDDDCDEMVDEDTEQLTWYADNDGDGVGAELVEGCARPPNGTDVTGDCDDSNPNIGPQAAEVCDGVDQNCNDIVDEGTADGRPTWTDADSDGYGDPAGFFVVCDPGAPIPAGRVENSADCDDGNDLVFEGAPELCDDEDNDCDSVIDEGVGIAIYADDDGDGFGDPDMQAFSCDLPVGWSNNPFDCNDAEALAHAGATEACDTVDNDCNGFVDEGVTLTWWPDVDGDQWGDDAGITEGCTPPADAVFVGGDCNDNDASSNPVGNEVCDFADNDCDTRIDEGLTVSWWVDGDGDTYGDPDQFQVGCVIPGNGVQRADDCDDSDPLTNPLGTEVCNLNDEDCDGIVDDGVAIVYWADGDGDGIGTTNLTFTRDCSLPAGFATSAGDCDDANGAVGAGCASDLAGDMTTFGVGVARTGHQPGYVAGGEPTELWSEVVAGTTLTAPSLENGVVYFASNGVVDTLHARDALTGAVVWDLALTAGVNVAQPTVDSGLVYAQTIDAFSTTLLAVDSVSGLTVWGKTPNAASDIYRAPLVYSGNVYIGAGGLGGMSAYDAGTGAPVWTFSGPDVDDWTAAGFGSLVWTQLEDDLVGRNPTTGVVDVTVTLPAGPLNPTRMSTVPAFDDNMALVVAGDDLVAVDLLTTEVTWTIANGFSGSPTIADGMGYAVHSGTIWQVDMSDSLLVRQFTGDPAISGKPIVTDDVIVAGSPTVNYVWDLSTGDLLYTISAGNLALGEDLAVTTTGATITVEAL